MVHHFTHNKNRTEYPLDGIIVNCNDWASLFKGLGAYLGKYRSDLLKKLVSKFEELHIHDCENVRASVFCKAVFMIHEDTSSLMSMIAGAALNKGDQLTAEKEKKKLQEEARLRKLEKNRIGDDSPRKTTHNLKDLSKALEAEKAGFLKTSGTLGRAALREQNEYTDMYTLDTRDPTMLMSLDVRDLMRGTLGLTIDLTSLDQVIYKEGRTKRNRQSLQDSLLSKIKDISESYDGLFEIVETITQRYQDLGR